VKMHRMLTQCPATKVVDHVNGDRLDNRRRNLRICSPKENSRNKGMGRNNQSGFPGVSKTSNGKWRVRIMVNRKEIALGRYAAMEEAIQVRREAEEKYFGDMSSAKSRSGQ
ncbi:MAG TPA: HNH endonuclease, partial [Candidatus Alectryocaccomicrobium excrementavium]|nr:HNH endonuclease [Candidatus Alectryocaccomicrobium excrementavium]